MIYLNLLCRGLLGAVFLIAFGGKVRSPAALRAFAGSLADLGWLSARLRPAAVVGLLVVEGATVLLVVWPGTAAAGFAAAFALLVVFVLGVGLSMRRGERVRCLCFGADRGPMGVSDVVRNLVLAAVAALGFGSSLAGGTAVAGGAIAAVAGGVAAGVVATRWDDLRFLLSA
ncbi:hypothetical protein ABH926_010183 [Catenulispora sp. GP43]|uniref:MauE/DoxX family redox-associated membrane protein n=1 Tax=Catenulispora sp. GP43 TaxID=3156263 RepID=UPI003513EAC4